MGKKLKEIKVTISEPDYLFQMEFRLYGNSGKCGFIFLALIPFSEWFFLKDIYSAYLY